MKKLKHFFTRKHAKAGDNRIDQLPLELKFLIFSQLAIKDLAHLAAVSTKWRDETSNTGILWQRFGFKARTGELQSALSAYNKKEKPVIDILKDKTFSFYVLAETQSQRDKIFNLSLTPTYAEWCSESYEGNLSRRNIIVHGFNAEIFKSRITSDISLQTLQQKVKNQKKHATILLPVVENEDQVISYLQKLTKADFSHLIFFITIEAADPGLANKLNIMGFKAEKLSREEDMLSMFEKISIALADHSKPISYPAYGARI